MNITLTPEADAPPLDPLASKALRDWYDSKPYVRRLWAIRPDGASDATTLRILVMLDPSPDGDDHSPRWMASGAQWSQELSKQLAAYVQLERIDGPLPDVFEIDGDGVLLSTLCWRDPTVIQD